MHVLKKYILIAVASLALAACSKPQYQKTIELYLQTNLHDPKSYENVEMDTPKKVTLMTQMLEQWNDDRAAGKPTFSPDSLSFYIELWARTFKDLGEDPYEVIGWEVDHSYRANNGFGAKVLTHVRYTLNPEQTEIKKVKNL